MDDNIIETCYGDCKTARKLMSLITKTVCFGGTDHVFDTGDLKSCALFRTISKKAVVPQRIFYLINFVFKELPPKVPREVPLLKRSPWNNFIRRYDEIGRHSRLKICQRKLCTGSSPVSGTIGARPNGLAPIAFYSGKI